MYVYDINTYSYAGLLIDFNLQIASGFSTYR